MTTTTVLQLCALGFCLFGLYVLIDPDIVWRIQENSLRRSGVKYVERPDDFWWNHPRIFGFLAIGSGLLLLLLFS